VQSSMYSLAMWSRLHVFRRAGWNSRFSRAISEPAVEVASVSYEMAVNVTEATRRLSMIESPSFVFHGPVTRMTSLRPSVRFGVGLAGLVECQLVAVQTEGCFVAPGAIPDALRRLGDTPSTETLWYGGTYAKPPEHAPPLPSTAVDGVAWVQVDLEGTTGTGLIVADVHLTVQGREAGTRETRTAVIGLPVILELEGERVASVAVPIAEHKHPQS